MGEVARAVAAARRAQVDEVAVVDVLGDLLEVLHELGREAHSSVLGGDRDGRHVPVPQLALALGLAHHVAHDPPVGRLGDLEVLGVARVVLIVEAHVVLRYEGGRRPSGGETRVTGRDDRLD